MADDIPCASNNRRGIPEESVKRNFSSLTRRDVEARVLPDDCSGTEDLVQVRGDRELRPDTDKAELNRAIRLVRLVRHALGVDTNEKAVDKDRYPARNRRAVSLLSKRGMTVFQSTAPAVLDGRSLPTVFYTCR